MSGKCGADRKHCDWTGDIWTNPAQYLTNSTVLHGRERIHQEVAPATLRESQGPTMAEGNDGSMPHTVGTYALGGHPPGQPGNQGLNFTSIQ